MICLCLDVTTVIAAAVAAGKSSVASVSQPRHNWPLRLTGNQLLDGMLITACLLSILTYSLTWKSLTAGVEVRVEDMNDIRAQDNVLAYISNSLVPDLLVMSCKTDLGQGNISTALPKESTATT